MKKVIVLLFLTAGLFACKQEVRYSQSSPEVDDWKKIISEYENGDCDNFRTHFADTAKVYRNSTEPMSADDLVAEHKESLAIYSTYGFEEGEGDAEMVVTDEGETWVNFWGTWKGTMEANGKTYTIPVHTTSQYVDGKIVKYYGYWDGTEVALAIQAMEAAAAAMQEAQMEEEAPQ